MKLGYVVLMLAVSGFISGCSFNSDPVDDKPVKAAKKSLGEVYFEPLPLNFDPLPDQGLENLANSYTQLLTYLTDPHTRQIIQYRLADLEVLLAEQRQEAGTKPLDKGYYDLAIDQFEQLLQQHPEHTDNAEILYQLAKSYDLQGQIDESLEVIDRLLKEYPDTPYGAELSFRKGEILFNRGQYAEAIGGYSKVLTVGSQSDYFMTAAYMSGWSHFKLEQYKQSQLAFTKLLDQKLPNSVIDQQMLRQLRAEQQLELLPLGEKRIVNDSIRIMSMLFSYQAAEKSLQAFYAEIGERHYEHLLYEQLGQQFLNEDRYRDSALVYHAFTETHPDHNQAPFFAVKQIDAYILGDFPTLVLPAKQEFIKQYGINGPYWRDWGQLIQDDVKPFLREYIQELAQFEHSKAQLLAKAAARPEQQNESEIAEGEQLRTRAENKQNSLLAFSSAANLYRQFLHTFPYDELAPQITFNLADSLYDGENYIEAIEAYETFAYRYNKEPRAAEAGYAAILTFRELQKVLVNEADKVKWRDLQLESQHRFVKQFADDERADDVLYDTMQQLFALQRYRDAMQDADTLLDWQPQVDAERILAGNLVIAHSQFALQQYAQAELSYEALLVTIPTEDPRHSEMLELLAASIYKQAEANLAKQYIALAVEDFLRIIAKAPASSVRINAQYDAATYLLELKDWQQAANLLEDFRIRFNSDPLTATIQDKLIHAYQQSENWSAAAIELRRLWRKDKKSAQGQQALYLAAQYFKQAGNVERSLDSYRTYAHAYPNPFDLMMESRFELSQFYMQNGDVSKRRYWLKKIIKDDAAAGNSRTERTRFMAAMGSMLFANDSLAAFEKIKLTLPLNKSLKRKKSALDKVLSELNNILQYKIAEYSTEANYKIAGIYATLAKDLMESERPEGLNTLELEQYDILLEEQAYPFEEQAIDVHETNAKRGWQGVYDQWVRKSFESLRKLLPGRYNKQEQVQEVENEIL